MLAETNEIIYLSDIAVCRLMSLVRTRIQKIRRDKSHVSECNHESKADENILTQAWPIRSFSVSQNAKCFSQKNKLSFMFLARKARWLMAVSC